jgi:sRNA-binding carbon storage regulator CsrA
MQTDNTIGYAIKIGDEIEIRILNVRGEQRRVELGSSPEVFSNHESICRRIEAEKRAMPGRL